MMAIFSPIRDGDQPDGMIPFGGAPEPPETAPAALPTMGEPKPPESVLGSEVAPGQPIPENRMKTAEHLAENPQAEANFRGKQDFHSTMRGFDQREAANRGSMLALDPNDPQYLQKLAAHQAQEGVLKAEKAHFSQMHPWGTPESEHPGVLGKIAHVASRVGQIAGSAVAPQVVEEIPGTQANLGAQERTGQAEEAGAGKMAEEANKSEEEKQKANLEHAQAEVAGNPKPEKETPQEVLADAIKDAQRRNVDPATDPKVQQAEKAIQSIQKPANETQEQNKLAFQAVASKVAEAGLSTDPKDFAKSLKAAKDKGIISPKEFADASAYESANPTPGTNLGIHIEGLQAAQGIKDAHATYRYSDATGTHVVKGNQIPRGVDAVPIKDPALYQSEAKMSNIVQQSMNRIHEDIRQNPEIFDNAAARAILATTLEQVDRTSAGMLVAGTGGSIPLPSGLGDMINTSLQNRALDTHQAEALKQYIADYKAMKDKAIVMQMEMQNGKIGRGAALQMKAITDQIPNGSTADSKTALRQMQNLQQTQDEIMSQYPDDEWQGFRKVKSSEPTEAATGENAPPPGAKVRDYSQLGR